jgi:hypothetical protein
MTRRAAKMQIQAIKMDDNIFFVIFVPIAEPRYLQLN